MAKHLFLVEFLDAFRFEFNAVKEKDDTATVFKQKSASHWQGVNILSRDPLGRSF